MIRYQDPHSQTFEDLAEDSVGVKDCDQNGQMNLVVLRMAMEPRMKRHQSVLTELCGGFEIVPQPILKTAAHW